MYSCAAQVSPSQLATLCRAFDERPSASLISLHMCHLHTNQFAQDLPCGRCSPSGLHTLACAEWRDLCSCQPLQHLCIPPKYWRALQDKAEQN